MAACVGKVGRWEDSEPCPAGRVDTWWPWSRVQIHCSATERRVGATHRPVMRAGEAAGGANSGMGSPRGICSATCPVWLVLEDLGATRAGGEQPPPRSGPHVPTLSGQPGPRVSRGVGPLTHMSHEHKSFRG